MTPTIIMLLLTVPGILAILTCAAGRDPEITVEDRK